MNRKLWNGTAIALVVGLGLVSAGCNNAEQKQSEKSGKQGTQVADAKTEHDHSGWWCAEHGVPEEICGLCSDKAAKDLKAKGDWCKQHDRPNSQCFICQPDLKEKFAAIYRAKIGKEPPPLEDDTK